METTTYYLQMLSASELAAKPLTDGLNIVKAEIPEWRFNRFLYQLVGEPWHWVDKLKLDDSVWKAYVESPRIHTWVAYHRGAIAGYFELNAQQDGNTEIAYFGLAPNFIGQGFGAALLSSTIENAWKLPSTQRVWVHTCSLDHPSALGNYQARGLKLYKTEVEDKY